MAPTYHSRRHSTNTLRPFVAFLLIASFGILFAGCNGAPPIEEEEFTFTAEDLARFRELARTAQDEVGQQTGTGTFVPRLNDDTQTEGSEDEQIPVLDLSDVKVFNEIRQGPGAVGENLYKVTNEFLNVRSAPNVTAASVGRILRGDSLEVIEFKDAAWAHIRLPNNDEGYVSTRYIAKLVTEENLSKEKVAFEGMYFVNFGFLNVRKTPDTAGEKLGELPGRAIVKPISMDDVWVRVHFDGKEGYVAREYLEPFLPNFLVRQEKYNLPILHYRLSQESLTNSVAEHINRLRAEGYTFTTLRDFYQLVISQEERDVRLDPKSIILAFSEVTSQNIDDLSDVLLASKVPATLFLSSKNLGIDGITEKQVLTLLANRFDLQSGAHSGDDLRAMTNAQVELELQQSRKILEDLTNRQIVAVAYPIGGVNDRVMEKTAESGYLFGIGVAPKTEVTRGEFLQMPSLLVSGGMSAEDVLLLVRGE